MTQRTPTGTRPDPAVTARAVLTGPPPEVEPSEVELAIRSLVRDRGTDWIVAVVTCPTVDYPRLTGTADQLHVATSTDRARLLITHVLDRHTAPEADHWQESVTLLLLNDPHPFFDRTGSGAGLGEDLWDLHQHGADDRVHLLARNPFLTEVLLSRLCPHPRGATNTCQLPGQEPA